MDGRGDSSHVHPREHAQALRRWLPLRRPPDGLFVSAVAALGTFYNDAKDIFDKDSRDKQVLRLVAKMPTLASMCYRFSAGLPFVYPDNDISFPANFLQMMWKIGEYEIDPRLERAMDLSLIHISEPTRPY